MKKIFGILFFCLLLLVCTVAYKPFLKHHIERDLDTKVASILEEAGHDPSGARLNGHQLEIPAELASSFSEETYNELDNVIGVYITENAELDSKPAVVKIAVTLDPRISIEEADTGSITISGRVSNEDTRQAILSAIKDASKDKPVIDKLVIELNTHAIFPLPALTKLIPNHLISADLAQIHYSPDTLVLLGNLDNSSQEQDLVALARPILSNGNKLTNKLKIVPFDPLHFRAERATGQITLTGVLPNKEEQSKLLAHTKEGAAGTPIIDNTTIATKPTPDFWWKNHPETFISNHFKNTQGPAYVEYAPQIFNASGTYNAADAYQVSQQKLTSIPEQITTNSNLVYNAPEPKAATKTEPSPVTAAMPTPAPSPQPVTDKQKLATTLKQLPLYFNTDSDYIQRSEMIKIKTAVKIINDNTKDIKGLTVGGFADMRGDAASNKSLSLKRANAVRDQLIKLGVNADILTIEHFGEDVSTMKKSELWKARRVELSIRPL